MPRRSWTCLNPHRDTYDITARCRNIARSGENTMIARAADLQANGLSQNCHGPELETYCLLVIPHTPITDYTQWTPTPFNIPLGSPAYRPSPRNVKRGRALHGVQTECRGRHHASYGHPLCLGLWTAGITNISGVSKQRPRVNFVCICLLNAHMNNKGVCGKRCSRALSVLPSRPNTP